MASIHNLGDCEKCCKSLFSHHERLRERQSWGVDPPDDAWGGTGSHSCVKDHLGCCDCALV